MYHYLVLRQDLPLGNLCAQLTHASGESARLAPELPPDTHAVVLTVPGEADLLEIAARLSIAGIPHIVIREPDAPYCGQATAIGVCPMERKPVRKVLGNLPLIK